MKIRTLNNLRKMSDVELVEGHDNLVSLAVLANFTIQPSDYLDELQRRHENRQKNWVMWFTGIISLATVLNVAFFIYEVVTK